MPDRHRGQALPCSWFLFGFFPLLHPLLAFCLRFVGRYQSVALIGTLLFWWSFLLILT